MLAKHKHALSEQAPLALLYHENSKLHEASSHATAEAIAEFSSNVDALRFAATSFKTYPGTSRIDLSPFLVRRFPDESLGAILHRRRSVRSFQQRPLPLAVLAQLLTRACGVTTQFQHADHPEIRQSARAYPSGGALFPIEIYLAALDVDDVPAGLYHFHAPQQALECVQRGEFRDELQRRMWLANEALHAPAVLLLTGRWGLPLRKYGERGYRVLLLDAGCVLENLIITATSLEQGTCPIAGFHDDPLGQLIGVDPSEEPVLCCLLVGTPSEPR